MKRHAGLPNVPEAWAQIRPHRGGQGDLGVLTETRRHQHVKAILHKHTASGVVVANVRPDRTGEVALSHPRESTQALRKHQAGHRTLPDDAVQFTVADLVARYPVKMRVYGTDGWHAHEWRWTDHLQNEDYATAFVKVDDDRREIQHMAYQWTGDDYDGRWRKKPRAWIGDMWHIHDEHAKYLYPPSGRDEHGRKKKDGRASGIEVHPLAEDLLDAGADACYFVMEGLLKNDAVLSLGVPVFNCGSVTLWDRLLPEGGSEFDRFATERLLGKFGTVVIIPDSDWSTNPQVEWQARLVQRRLESIGLDSIIAAPPPKAKECGQDMCTHKRRGKPHPDHKNGIDDFIGQEGGTLDRLRRLELIHQDANDLVIEHANTARTLAELCRLSDSHGRIMTRQKELAERLEIHTNTLRSCLRRLEDDGAITYEVDDFDGPIGDGSEQSRLRGSITLRRDLWPTTRTVELGRL
jgi:hypothetical protein